MNDSEAITYLEQFVNYEYVKREKFPRTFHLTRVAKLLELLGNPQQHLKIIHIAGSKGKGSTAAMLAHVLKAANYRTGLYTSPHIDHYRERIRILDQTKQVQTNDDLFVDAMTLHDLAGCLTQMQSAIETVQNDERLGQLSFFEIFTALALFYFQQQNVDWVVLETGLGGRYDATNVVDSTIAMITQIDLEHTHVLGHTLTDIAAEKAAIIKSQRQHVVIAPQEQEVQDVFEQQCRNVGAEYVIAGEDMDLSVVRESIEGQSVRVSEAGYAFDMQLPLVGEHQIKNLANVLSCVKLLRQKGCVISQQHIQTGMAQTYWPIRFERVACDPDVILDAAHTPTSVKTLVQTMQRFYGNHKVCLIVGFSEDKDIQTMCGYFNQLNADIILTRAQHVRAVDLSKEMMQGLFPDKVIQKTDNVAQAVQLPKQGAVTLITGSVFVASEARKLLCTSTKV